LIDAEITFTPREQVYPSEAVSVVYRSESGNEIAQMKWGWERSFAKRPLINTRAREAWDKPTWRNAIRKRRCVVPVSAYFEWNENQAKGKRDCYRIDPTLDNGFALGGLYEVSPKTGKMFMSILTTAPNKKMAEIHHRMPVIIDKSKFRAWLESDERDEINALLAPVNSEQIELRKM
jgi:putative SOS response-associated peptidase YedK